MDGRGSFIKHLLSHGRYREAAVLAGSHQSALFPRMLYVMVVMMRLEQSRCIACPPPLARPLRNHCIRAIVDGMNTKNIPEPIPAATLILARPHESSFQVYLLKRSPKSRFLPSVYVFPGGTLEPEDHGLDRWKDHLDMDGNQFEKRLGGQGFSTEAALPYAVAAVRETFEEAGVWLVHKNGAPYENIEALQNLRKAETLPSTWFLEVVQKHGWVLNLSRMRRWSHWITPVGLPYRFDTRFYLTHMPQDQVCLPDMKETVAGVWVTPKEALEGGCTGDMPLSPPILATLQELMTFESFDALMDSARRRSWGAPLMPRLIPLKGGNLILEPWDPLYDEDQPQVKPPCELNVLLPEVRFSRIWHDGRIWRPV